jgi:hypothetical protein
MSTLLHRNERLFELSKMVIDGHIIQKLDHIATIFINNRMYFNVFRRYNSPYNIIIEDYNYDLYFNQDCTVRASLQNILCLSNKEASNLYKCNATSYVHNGPAPSTDKDIADMVWTEIHTAYQSISVNFGGIFNNRDETIYTEDIPVEPQSQNSLNNCINSEDIEAAHTLLTLRIPRFDVELDEPSLSLRVTNNNPSHLCYCQMNDDDEDDDKNYKSDDDSKSNFTVLRSGAMIPKPCIQI